MGLDIDVGGGKGCDYHFELWHGGYSSYKTLLDEIEKVDKKFFKDERCPELYDFLYNNYFEDPYLPWQICDKLPRRLLLISNHITEENSWGHLERQGGMKKCVERLAIGFQMGFDKKEKPWFH